MNYQVIAPPPALRNFVRYFWTLEDQATDGTQKTFTVMSSGEPGLIFQQHPAAFTGFEGEHLPQLFVFGQATKYGDLHCSSNFRTIGISFQPTALRSLFGLSADQLTDKNTCISHLTKTALNEQLLNSGSVHEQVAHLCTFLLAQTTRGVNKQLDYAVTALQQGKKIAQVVQDLNCSERWLERLFLTHIGITPILYARIRRFQTSVTLLGTGRVRSLTDLAHSLGYFDQSHFIRDFKIFSGVSPGIYLREAIERMPGFPEWQ